MNQELIFICADENHNRGEADYVLAMMGELRLMEEQGYRVTTHAFKVPTFGGTFALAEEKKNILVDPKNLRPETYGDYEKIPYAPENMRAYFDKPDTHYTVIGCGHSTINTTRSFSDSLNRMDGVAHRVAQIAHTVEHAAYISTMASRDTKLFMPTTRDALRETFGDDVDRLDIEPIDTPPHTNTMLSARGHYDAFMRDDAPDTALARVKEWQTQNKPYAFAVINAGFMTNDVWTPYTLDEAREHGRSLAATLPKGTNLCALHGGPRNLRDKKELGADPADAFIQGFLEAQGDDAGETVLDAFDGKFNAWNAIKVSQILAQDPLCVAYISNAEGFGTMDGIAQAVDNTEKLLGAFPYAALRDDPAKRMDNFLTYHEKGFAWLTPDADASRIVKHHDNEQRTPRVVTMRPSQIIFDRLGIGHTSRAQPIVNHGPKPQ